MKLAIIAATSGVLALTALGLASQAAAVPTGAGSAADTVKSLQADGYTVQINGATTTSPLSECTVTAVHPGSTIYVDIACPTTG
jgi:hypothetical protein